MGEDALKLMAQNRAVELLTSAEPVYFILDRKNLPTLEFLPIDVADRVQIVGTVDLDGKPDGEDWVIVTNHGGRVGDAVRKPDHIALAPPSRP